MEGMMGMGADGRDLAGQTVLITGATGGIGLAAARALARRGATVAMVGHRREPDQEAVAAVVEAAGEAERVVYYDADLLRQDAVRELAERVRADQSRLDVLINNVGGYFSERALTVDGYERTWALNHLNTALLTCELLDLLKASAPARIVNVSSDAHKGARLKGARRNGALLSEEVATGASNRAKGFRVYAEVKLAVVMATYALARRLEGTGVTVNAVHPGLVATGFFRELPAVFQPLLPLLARSPEQGAAPVVHLAASDEVAGVSGTYWTPRGKARSAGVSYDEAAQEQLWATTLTMVGQPGCS
jgi:NAD(P)-dependent dehydrogenase (short-subunit alcohol dehydrogenase family)